MLKRVLAAKCGSNADVQDSSEALIEKQQQNRSLFSFCIAGDRFAN
jgi:hypothetical protein